MPKDEWGVKRQCGACGARFYDLQREPVDCPKCGETYSPLAAIAKGKVTRATASERAKDDDDELEDDEDLVIEDDGDKVEIDEDGDAVVVEASSDDDDDDDDDEDDVSEDDLGDDVLLDDDEDDDDDLGDFSVGGDDNEKDA